MKLKYNPLLGSEGIRSVFDGTELWLFDFGLSQTYGESSVGQFLVGKGQDIKDESGWNLNCTIGKSVMIRVTNCSHY